MPTLVKWVSLLIIVTSLSAIVFGTGAFSAVTADRIGEIDTASDETALLGVDIEDRSIRTNQEVVLATVTNRFDGAVENVSVQVVDEGGFNRVRITGTPDSLQPGESGDIRGRVVCGSQSSGTVDITITAEGTFGSVELTRSVDIDCATGGPTCTPSGDDRIGKQAFVAENETFNCSIEIDANQYRVGLEETTITGDFDLAASNHREFAMSDSDVGGSTTIDVGKNLNGDVSVESSTFGGPTELRVGGNLAGSDIEIDGTTVNGDLRIVIDGNMNGDLSIEDSHVTGDVEIVVAGNANGEVSLSRSTVDGSITITADGKFGDASIDSTDVGDDVSVTVARLSGDLEVTENDVGSDLVVTVDRMQGGSVEIENNDVGGEVRRQY
ncbi:hypothetical protein [Halopenitus persicus]|uniref:hypothetical protein n=1 Tax=Halopenitus persicus TaxID=1048396 RepID=UPI0012FD6466|nr:hypothetical protein [Halopenitus persicus]